MQCVVPGQVGSHAILKVQLLNHIRDAPHIIVASFLIEQALVSQLSKFAVLIVAAAGLSHLDTFGECSIGN
jgi:hypothetical protein